MKHLTRGLAALTLTALLTSPVLAQKESKKPTQQETLLKLINDYRKANKKPALETDAKRPKAAQAHSDWMQSEKTLSHTGKDDSTPLDRMKAEGLKPMGGAENIALAKSAKQAFELWKKSPGHKKNILGDYNKAGI